jgi:uncharacterized protein DUF3179
MVQSIYQSIKNNKWIALLALALIACTPVIAQEATTVPTPIPADTSSDTTSVTPLPGNLDTVVFVKDNTRYIIQQLLPRDGIPPIYDPQFTSAEQSGFNPDELVMGVEINDDARAYPVGLLRRREIVNDVVGGIPILITW